MLGGDLLGGQPALVKLQHHLEGQNERGREQLEGRIRQLEVFSELATVVADDLRARLQALSPSSPLDDRGRDSGKSKKPRARESAPARKTAKKATKKTAEKSAKKATKKVARKATKKGAKRGAKKADL